MTTLYLVRHGETDWNSQGRFQGRAEIELNEKGKKQAAECTKYLKNFSFDAILTSPLSRAVQTANIISKEMGIKEVTIITGLIEKDMGEATGLSSEERKSRFKDGIIPKAETREQIKKRVFDTLNLIDELYTDKNLIVVTHGGIIKFIMDILEPDFSCKEVIIQNGSITILKGNGYNWKVDLFNYYDY